MGPNHSHAKKGSWLDQREFEADQSSNWLDLYRRHLSWIKSTDQADDESMLNDLASEM